MQNRAPVSKATYIFLCAMLGALLFLLLQRIFIFLCFIVLIFSRSLSEAVLVWLGLELINYLTVLFAIIGGAWYGVWLGISWYETVYERDGHESVFKKFGQFISQKRALNNVPAQTKKMSELTKRVEDEMWQLELAKSQVKTASNTIPVKRKISRKKTFVEQQEI